MNNKVVGVAFETHLNAQNIGYCIPMKVVMHFLNDIEKHGKYTSFPKLGFRWQKIENPSLKKYYKMMSDENKDKKEENETDEEEKKDDDGFNGILINSTYPLTDCSNKLCENDVVLAMDEISLGEDGTIPYEYPEDGVARINHRYIISNKFCGDEVKLKILRDGKILDITIIINIIDYLVPIVLYEKPVTYFIFGGIVFLPLSRPYLRSEYGSKWSSKCAVRLKDLYFNGYKEEKHEQVIVLSRVLASEENVGYHKFKNCVSEKCNGVETKNMTQLTQIIDNAVQNKEQFVTFIFEHHITIVLEIETALTSMNKIMKNDRIEFDR
eukprot:358657_1